MNRPLHRICLVPLVLMSEYGGRAPRQVGRMNSPLYASAPLKLWDQLEAMVNHYPGSERGEAHRGLPSVDLPVERQPR